MKNLTILSYILLLLMVPLASSAATTCYEKRYLGTQDQLPVSAIHSVYRDTEGYLWYGTVNGLCRDDGYQLQVFRPGFLQAQDRVIECMAEDRSGHIWLGSDNGLSWIDKADYTIHALCPERWEGERVNRILPADIGLDFLIQSRSRIIWVDSVGHPIREFCWKDKEGNERGIAWSVPFHKKTYIAFNDFSFCYVDSGRSELHPIALPKPYERITSFDIDRQKEGLWLLDESGKVCHLKDLGDGFKIEPYECNVPMGGFAYRLQQSPYDDTLWLINLTGVNAYRKDDGNRLTLVYSSRNDTPPNHMLASVWCDSLFTFVSAFDCKNFMLRPKTDIFQYIPLQTLTDRVMFNAAVMDMAEAGDDWWWIFQERTGLCLVHRPTGKVVLYSDCRQAATYGLDRGRIIAPSVQGVWVNHDAKMHVYRVTRQEASMSVVADIDLSAQARPGEFVTQLLEDASRRLWVGTNLGLHIFDAASLQPLSGFPTLGYVSTIQPDEHSRVWVTTIEGRLYDFGNATENVCHEIGEPLSALCIMPDGDLWLGTQLGSVFRYEPRQRMLEDYSVQIGLNGDRVNQLQDDSYGHLWVETNQRILEFNPRNNASRIFKTNDIGIPLTRFLPTSSMKDSSGRIYFGGIPGVMRFTPSNSLDKKSAVVIPRITDVVLMKHSLRFDTLVVRQNTRRITLQPDDRDLEIFFSSLDHYDVSLVRYAYRLNGVDEDWNYTVAGENSAFYNHLEKGHYTFEVKATDRNGLWSAPVMALEIERLPAFYESSLAYCLYCLAVLLALAALIYWVHRSDEKKNEQMWSDSETMLSMRNYINDDTPSAERLPESEFLALDNVFLEKATQAVMDHLEESDFGVEELAAAVHVSKSTLNRKMKSITGLSPLDFMRAQKMRQAKLWLQDKDRNITEIAISLGYSDRKYFTACFKKEFGMTPTEYRKDVLGNKFEDDE